MSVTPLQRTTRSGSNSSNITLLDIKTLIEKSKEEILGTVKNEVEKLKEMTNTLLKRVDKLEHSQKVLNERCKELENRQDKSSREENLFATTEQLISELNLRAQKDLNLIIYGIPEHESGRVDERREKDNETIKALAEELGVEQQSFKTQRIGKIVPQRPRLIRIKCDRLEVKYDMLRKAKELRKSDFFRKVYIAPDLTPIQQNYQKKLRDELKKRREDGESNLMIHRGKIIDRNSRRERSFRHAF